MGHSSLNSIINIFRKICVSLKPSDIFPWNLVYMKHMKSLQCVQKPCNFSLCSIFWIENYSLKFWRSNSNCIPCVECTFKLTFQFMADVHTFQWNKILILWVGWSVWGFKDAKGNSFLMSFICTSSIWSNLAALPLFIGYEKEHQLNI
jgi:hypothetical protein